MLLSSLLAAAIGWSMMVRIKRRLKNAKIKIAKSNEIQRQLEDKLKLALESSSGKSQLPNDSMRAQKRILLANQVISLKQKANNNQTTSVEVCEEIVQLFAELHPSIISKLYAKYQEIKPTDILICILVSQGFGQSEIARITNHERQHVRQYIQRISKGLTGESIGRMADFKALLDEQFFCCDNNAGQNG